MVNSVGADHLEKLFEAYYSRRKYPHADAAEGFGDNVDGLRLADERLRGKADEVLHKFIKAFSERNTILQNMRRRSEAKGDFSRYHELLIRHAETALSDGEAFGHELDRLHGEIDVKSEIPQAAKKYLYDTVKRIQQAIAGQLKFLKPEVEHIKNIYTKGRPTPFDVTLHNKADTILQRIASNSFAPLSRAKTPRPRPRLPQNAPVQGYPFPGAGMPGFILPLPHGGPWPYPVAPQMTAVMPPVQPQNKILVHNAAPAADDAGSVIQTTAPARNGWILPTSLTGAGAVLAGLVIWAAVAHNAASKNAAAPVTAQPAGQPPYLPAGGYGRQTAAPLGVTGTGYPGNPGFGGGYPAAGGNPYYG